MTDEMQKKVFSKNLNYYIEKSQKTQKEVADAIGVSPQTLNTWCRAVALPRMGKVQRLADYFRIEKTDLIDEHVLSSEPKKELSPLEWKIIEEFRRTDGLSQSMVLRILGIEKEGTVPHAMGA